MFDNPKKELEALEEQLLQHEAWFEKELESAKRMIGQAPQNPPKKQQSAAAGMPKAPKTPAKPAPKKQHSAAGMPKAPKTPAEPAPKKQQSAAAGMPKAPKTPAKPAPKKKSVKGLLILASLEFLGILGLAGYWVLVLLK